MPLTEKGVTQARITADYILKTYKIDAIYSSDLSRAIETAKPVADALGLEIKCDPRLREIYAGKWQGMLFSDVHVVYAEDYKKYKTDRVNATTTGGEGMSDVLKRSLAAVRDIVRENDGKTVLVSAHNGPLMALQAPFLGIELSYVKSLYNNSITEVDCEGDDFKVIKLGYSDHLGGLLSGFKSTTHN